MAQVEEVRHQAAIAGRVTNQADGSPIAGVRVTVSGASASFAQWLALKALRWGAAWDGLAIRPDRTLSATDGHFQFIDLPDDTYTVAATWPEQDSRYGTAITTATVARDASGSIKLVPIELALPPTAISGDVKAKGAPVPIASVRLKGSGESTLADLNGHYVLFAIEPGQRTVQVEGVGFAPTESAVKVDGPGKSATLDFSSS
jgi:hypothetical protein